MLSISLDLARTLSIERMRMCALVWSCARSRTQSLRSDKKWPNLWTNRHAFVYKFSLIKNLLVKFIHQCCLLTSYSTSRSNQNKNQYKSSRTCQIVGGFFSAFGFFCYVMLCFLLYLYIYIVYECFVFVYTHGVCVCFFAHWWISKHTKIRWQMLWDEIHNS